MNPFTQAGCPCHEDQQLIASKYGTAAASPADRRALERLLTEFATALALGQLSDEAAAEVRGYLRRHLERIRTLLGPGAAARG